MKMDKKIIDNVTRAMFFVIFFSCLDCNKINDILEVIGAFTAAFNIFIYPGFFFYLANKERLDSQCRQYCYESVKTDQNFDKMHSTASE